MRFGKYLETEVVPEWKNKYIDYKGLKKCIKRIDARLNNNLDKNPILTYTNPTDYGLTDASQNCSPKQVEFNNLDFYSSTSNSRQSDSSFDSNGDSIHLPPVLSSNLSNYSMQPLPEKRNALTKFNPDYIPSNNASSLHKSSKYSQKSSNQTSPLQVSKDLYHNYDISKSIESIGYFDPPIDPKLQQNNSGIIERNIKSHDVISDSYLDCDNNEITATGKPSRIIHINTDPSSIYSQSFKKTQEVFKRNDFLKDSPTRFKKTPPNESHVVLIRRESTRYNPEQYDKVYEYKEIKPTSLENIDKFYEALLLRTDEEKEFFDALDNELNKINDFYKGYFDPPIDPKLQQNNSGIIERNIKSHDVISDSYLDCDNNEITATGKPSRIIHINTDPSSIYSQSFKKTQEVFKRNDFLKDSPTRFKKTPPNESHVVLIRRESTRYNPEQYDKVYEYKEIKPTSLENIDKFYEALLLRTDEEKEFFDALDNELNKINDFYKDLQTIYDTFKNVFGFKLNSKPIKVNSDSETLTKIATEKAQGRLKKAIMEVHRGIEMLKNFRILNHTGFAKIIKKYNKTTNWRSGGISYLKKVENYYFLKDTALDRTLKGMEELFRLNYTNGSLQDARAMLRMPLTSYKVLFYFYFLINCIFSNIFNYF
ncbi:SPX and EXS domain-containing protein 5 [Smittium mucronatum]|uniref:SPX and EXS domain-containing protein 5 n=1 Tax=Smittium mucronatum TaxID=133383 RepID=A0A1R0H0R5_9FUNG|nr:SPX and EXS domain-containing protein 5 [Smittium mucronatum]